MSDVPQKTISNTPPPRIALFEPFADVEPVEVFPTGLRDEAKWKREAAARLLDEAFDLEAMAREAELTHVG